mmetsp:Transcript_18430/g.46602  ORF Transcript_18430/g.46602 Transcript_18430/m.46602 type:complete len:218 (+) Transcript_18430:230-883(+)
MCQRAAHAAASAGVATGAGVVRGVPLLAGAAAFFVVMNLKKSRHSSSNTSQLLLPATPPLTAAPPACARSSAYILRGDRQPMASQGLILHENCGPRDACGEGPAARAPGLPLEPPLPPCCCCCCCWATCRTWATNAVRWRSASDSPPLSPAPSAGPGPPRAACCCCCCCSLGEKPSWAMVGIWPTSMPAASGRPLMARGASSGRLTATRPSASWKSL